MRTLIVFYSRSGHTRLLAQELATRCSADLEEIREVNSREGFFGYCRSALQVLIGELPPILKLVKNPSDYDIVIIGTPVWMQRPAPPVLTFLTQNAAVLKRVAFFCTLGGSGDRRTFKEMGRRCGKQPLGTLTVTEKELPTALHATQLSDFVARIPHAAIKESMA